MKGCIRAALGTLLVLGAAPSLNGAFARAAVGATAIGVMPSIESSTCVAPDEVGPPPYYAIDLVTTRRVPGTGLAHGVANVTFATSPFGVSLAPDGSFLYDVRVTLDRIGSPGRGVFVAWATTTEVDRIQRLGALDEQFHARGRVSWNKFLVVITLEETDDSGAMSWKGPIVMRGMSRSGAMHTMAGHGPFQQELCSKYGYD